MGFISPSTPGPLMLRDPPPSPLLLLLLLPPRRDPLGPINHADDDKKTRWGTEKNGVISG